MNTRTAKLFLFAIGFAIVVSAQQLKPTEIISFRVELPPGREGSSPRPNGNV